MELMLANASGRPGQRDGQLYSHSAPQSRVATTYGLLQNLFADALGPQIWKRIAFVPRNKTYATTTLSKTAPETSHFGFCSTYHAMLRFNFSGTSTAEPSTYVDRAYPLLDTLIGRLCWANK